MKSRAGAVIIGLVGLLLSGCGGGGSSDSTATGQFIDGPVGGLSYVCGGLSGRTSVDGRFAYEAGKPVTFSVNGIVIGTATAAPVMTPITLAMAHNAAATAASPEVVNIVRFLMAISTIDANGTMAVDTSRLPAAMPSVVFTNTTSAFRSTMGGMMPTFGGTTADQAMAHLSASIYKQCAGTYRGTYSTVAVQQPSGTTIPATLQGSWSVTVTADGTVTGTTSTGDTLTGSLSNGVVFSATAGSLQWSGTLNPATNVLSGTCISTGRNPGGYTFTGARISL